MKHTNLGDSIFTMKKPDTSWHSTLVGVVAIIGFCLVILFTVSSLEISPVDSNRGCIASAYQASTNGFDFEDNLEVCNNL